MKARALFLLAVLATSLVAPAGLAAAGQATQTATPAENATTTAPTTTSTTVTISADRALEIVETTNPARASLEEASTVATWLAKTDLEQLSADQYQRAEQWLAAAADQQPKVRDRLANMSLPADLSDLGEAASEAKEQAEDVVEQPDGTPGETKGYTLDELRRNGEQISQLNPSRRPAGRMTKATLIHYPVGLFTDWGGQDFDFVGPETLVRRDRVRLVLNTFASGDRTMTVHTVYWREGTDTKVMNGTAVDVPAPADVVEDTQEIEVRGGRESLATVNLQNVDEETHVTMWIEGHPDEARWTFRYQTSSLVMPVEGINTAADLVRFGIVTFLLPAILGAALSWPVGKVLEDRMLVGPQKSWRWWTKVGLAVGFAGAVYFWSALASLLVSAGWVTGISTFAIALGVQLDNSEFLERVNFRGLMTSVGIRTGEEDDDLALRTTKVSPHVLRVIRRKGRHYAVWPGLKRALARAVAGPAEIRGWDAIEDEIDTTEGTSYDKEIELDPTEPQNIEIVPPQIRLRLPETTLKAVATYAFATIAAVGIGAGIAFAAWDNPLYGYVLAVPVLATAFVEGNDPHVSIAPASTMQMQAETRNTVLARDYGDATTNDELRRKIDSLESRSQAERITRDQDRRRVATDEILEARGANLDDLDEAELEALERAIEEDKNADIDEVRGR